MWTSQRTTRSAWGWRSLGRHGGVRLRGQRLLRAPALSCPILAVACTHREGRQGQQAAASGLEDKTYLAPNKDFRQTLRLCEFGKEACEAPVRIVEGLCRAGRQGAGELMSGTVPETWAGTGRCFSDWMAWGSRGIGVSGSGRRPQR